VLDASRLPTASQQVPLYRPPADLATRRPGTRARRSTRCRRRARRCAGREIAYVADPLDALSLQIQGSGALRIAEPDGRVTLVRVGLCGQQRTAVTAAWAAGCCSKGPFGNASWPGIKAWARANPQRLQEMLWTNPRVVFFREEPLSDLDASFGPRGAQGVPLTPGRSIAVDKDSIPYGTPVWLSTPGPCWP
jgi:membrane-bound lytic murein transglycosylase A